MKREEAFLPILVGEGGGGGETLGGNLIGSVLLACLPLHQWLQL